MKNHNMHRFLCLMLAVIMMCTLLPTTALADPSNSTVVLHPSTGTTPTGFKVSVGDTINGYRVTNLNNSNKEITIDLGTYNVSLMSFRIPLPEEVWTGVAMQYNPQTYVIAGTSGAVNKTPGANALLGNGENTFYYYNLGRDGTTYIWYFTLHYDANGGTGAPDDQVYATTSKYEKSYTFTIPQIVPSREGYTFQGWSETRNGPVTRQPGGNCLVSQTASGYNGGSVTKTLYAVWKENPPAPTEPDWSKLSISKTSNATDGTVASGDEITYTITVTNGTGKDLANITVSEPLDSNLTFKSANPSSGQYDSQTGVWTISSLANGGTATLTITATVKDGVTNGTTISNTATITGAADDDGNELPDGNTPSDNENVTVQNPLVVSGIKKEVMTSAPTDLTNVPTGITYPTNNSVTVPYGTTSVTLLYKVTVSGDAGASYSVTDEGATCISNNASGTIPQGGEAVLYFTKTFTNLITGDNTCSNTAAVGNTNSNTVDVTVKVSIPEKPTEKYLEEELLANGAVKIHCKNGDVEHNDATYGLIANSEGKNDSYSIGDVSGDAENGYTCTITVYPTPYVDKYNEQTGVTHKLDPDNQVSATITLKYVDKEWTVDAPVAALSEDAITGLVTFTVMCETPGEEEETFTVTYKDGVGGKVFKDDVHTVKSGDTTPAFVGGIPTRPGYVFVGWTPTVSKTVTGDATYVATWRKVKDTTVIEIGGGNSSGGEENPNTGAPVFVGVAIGALAAAK